MKKIMNYICGPSKNEKENNFLWKSSKIRIRSISSRTRNPAYIDATHLKNLFRSDWLQYFSWQLCALSIFILDASCESGYRVEPKVMTLVGPWYWAPPKVSMYRVFKKNCEYRCKRPSKLTTNCSRVLARERWQTIENSWKIQNLMNTLYIFF